MCPLGRRRGWEEGRKDDGERSSGNAHSFSLEKLARRDFYVLTHCAWGFCTELSSDPQLSLGLQWHKRQREGRWLSRAPQPCCMLTMLAGTRTDLRSTSFFLSTNWPSRVKGQLQATNSVRLWTFPTPQSPASAASPMLNACIAPRSGNFQTVPVSRCPQAQLHFTIEQSFSIQRRIFFPLSYADHLLGKMPFSQ